MSTTSTSDRLARLARKVMGSFRDTDARVRRPPGVRRRVSRAASRDDRRDARWRRRRARRARARGRRPRAVRATASRADASPSRRGRASRGARGRGTRADVRVGRVRRVRGVRRARARARHRRRRGAGTLALRIRAVFRGVGDGGHLHRLASRIDARFSGDDFVRKLAARTFRAERGAVCGVRRAGGLEAGY